MMSGPPLEVDCRFAWSPAFEMNLQLSCGTGLTLLTGPSGSGKSTLLGLICGILRPASGRIASGGRVLFDAARGIHVPPERRNIGLVSQDPCLFPHLSVEKNLKYGWKRRERHRPEFARVVKVLELGALLRRAPETLSGGQAQRVAIGRAVLSGPDILLLDEPLSALDAPLRGRVVEFLERIRGEYQLPALFVTHDPAPLIPLAEQLLRMDSGRIWPTPAETEGSAGPAAPTAD
ncbi:MAG: ATP-binding cassette domain-containing protein [Planctomycetaceae bacterium]|nr:ATP-binding cassette domain-containing protein [Planctomycetaceae bacterium]